MRRAANLLFVPWLVSCRGDGGRRELWIDNAIYPSVIERMTPEPAYAKLRDAALLLRRGARTVATHPDANCPTPDGPIPDVGSMIALLATSCGRTPEVIGKPNAAMAQGALADVLAHARRTDARGGARPPCPAARHAACVGVR